MKKKYVSMKGIVFEQKAILNKELLKGDHYKQHRFYIGAGAWTGLGPFDLLLAGAIFCID